jgi:FKBP-type peptidyl-prolyl cis-trans isomerase
MMKRALQKIIFPAFTLFLPAFLLAGCVKDDWKDKQKAESDIIDKYLKDNNIPESSKTEGGIYFIEEKAGTGSTPVKNDYVVINYTGRYLEDGSIHETNIGSLKSEWANAVTYSHFVYAPLKFRYGYSIQGLNEGLGMMKEGGKAKLIIPSDKAFYNFRPMEYEIELLKVIKDPVAWEDSVLTLYLADEGYDPVTAYRNIYFRETVTPDPLNHRTVQTNDTIIFRYRGRYVTGYGVQPADTDVFDSNMDDAVSLKLVYGKNEIIRGSILSIPKGLVTALDSMRSGTHATAVIPYSEGFGADGLISNTYGYTIVPRYQTLVYDIILEDLRPPLGK